MSFLDLSNKYVLAGLVAAVAVIGVGLYFYITRRNSKNSFAGPVEEGKVAPVRAPPSGVPSGQDAPVLVFFYATWCPHCTTMMGDWVEVEKALLGKVNVKAIESENPEMANHQIPGFPTLRMFPQGLGHPSMYVDYTGPRNADGIMKFVMEGPDAQSA